MELLVLSRIVVGALVGPSAAEPLTTVSQIGDMYVYFSMTEKQLLALN